MKKSDYINAIGIVLAIAIICVIFSYSVFSVAFSHKFYEKSLSKRMNSEQYAYYQEHINTVITYLQSAKANESLTGSIYSEKEISHMKDVRHIFIVLQEIFFVGSLIMLLCIIAIYFFDKEKFNKYIFSSIKYAGYSIIAICTLLFILFSNFSSAFINFHLMFFDNPNWMLSPEDSLIIMFPEEFFSSAAFSIAGIFAFYGILLLAAYYVWHRMNSK